MTIVPWVLVSSSKMQVLWEGSSCLGSHKKCLHSILSKNFGLIAQREGVSKNFGNFHGLIPHFPPTCPSEVECVVGKI